MCYGCVTEDIMKRFPEDEFRASWSDKEYQFSYNPKQEVPFTHCGLRKDGESSLRVSTAPNEGAEGASTPSKPDKEGMLIQVLMAREERSVDLYDSQGNDPRKPDAERQKKPLPKRAENKADVPISIVQEEDSPMAEQTTTPPPSQDEYYARVAEGKLSFSLSTKYEPMAIYVGPLCIVATTVAWRIPGVTAPCKHMEQSNIASPILDLSCLVPTAKVRVAAKLSKPGDDHLANEAANYQRFPDHLFKHWSGYYLQQRHHFHDPVPCGAVVPQFYGHYLPEITSSERHTGRYLSPIVLIEDCGQEIADPSKMDQDDRMECASLLHRFHDSDWTHGSVFQRNFVCQDGPLDATPLERTMMEKPKKSFRLIDFGRSAENKQAVQTEKAEVHSLFKDDEFGFCFLP